MSSPSLQPTFEVCSQCGTIHPPIKEGSLCPMRPVKSIDGKEIDISKFLATLKNILVSQIQIKQIRNMNKLMTEVVINVTKFFESYKE